MKFQTNPVIVEAERIEGVGEPLNGGSYRVLLEGQGPTSSGEIIKQSEMMGIPKVGDYLITHEDGTRNMVPKGPFEATHTLIDPAPGPLAKPVEPVDVPVDPAPLVETKHYSDGTSVTGPIPLPDHSPSGAPVTTQEPNNG